MLPRLRRFFRVFAATGVTPPYAGAYSLNISEANTYDAQVAIGSGSSYFPTYGSADDGGSLTQVTVGQGFNADQITYVAPFKLPTLAPGQTITGATLSFHITKSTSPAAPSQTVDLYGMARTDNNPTCYLGDFYVGSNDTANTRLQAGIIAPATANGYVTCNSAALVTWLNSCYSAGKTYAFARLNCNANSGSGLGSGTGYIVDTGDSTTRAFVPTLTLTVSNGAPTATSGQIWFTFNLPSSAFCSAGVFNNSTGVLLRRLWENLPYASGYNVGGWDGKDDSGNTLSAGTYSIKVISHNSAYTWKGTWGNTSANSNGPSVWRGFYIPCDMCIAGSKAYTVLGYNEQQAVSMQFAVGTPQVPTQVYPNGTVNDPWSNILFTASDGTNVYYARCAGGQGGAQYTYVFAISAATNNQVNFSGGTAVTGGQNSGKWTNGNVIDWDTTASQANPATGLAVQSSGNFLFVAHSNLNIIRVFNKTTGAAASSPTISITSPGKMCCDPSGNLYVITGSGFASYSINASTGAATALLTHSASQQPLALGVDPTGTYLSVIYGGADQFVATYSVSNFGTVLWIYGTTGGQTTAGPGVANNTFWFNSNTALAAPLTFICYQADGTFWIGDTANNRMMHFSVSGTTVTYIEQVAYVPENYITAVDYNTPTRATNLWLEYQLDYTKTPGGTNGSWTLVKNWAAGLPSQYNDTNTFNIGFDCVMTLSNSRVYATVHNMTSGNWDVVELTSAGVRSTGVTFSSRPRLYPDGSIRYQANSSTNLAYYQQSLTGFDGSGNPTYGSQTTVASITATALVQPGQEQQVNPARVETTSGGVYPIYDGDRINPGYHFGGIFAGTNTSFQFTSAPSTPRQAKLVLYGQPTAAQTFQLGANNYTAVASGATGRQFNIGGTVSATAANIATAVNANDSALVTATAGYVTTGGGWVYMKAPLSNTAVSTTVQNGNLANAFFTPDSDSDNKILSYAGGFPKDGTFDIGNNANYAGSTYMVLGSSIICGFVGETWKNGEASQWMHFHESGLFLGNFGTYAAAGSPNALNTTDGYTGNSYYSHIITVAGVNYLITNDESNHGGFVCWTIDASSIRIMQGSIALGSTGVVS